MGKDFTTAGGAMRGGRLEHIGSPKSVKPEQPKDKVARVLTHAKKRRRSS